MRGFLRSESIRAAINAAILCSFAFVQPLFDILGRAPEFLVAHRASASAIFTLTATLALALPALAALLVWGAYRVHRDAGRALIGAVVLVSAMALALLALRHAPARTWVVPGAIALAAGAAATFAYSRREGVRTFTTWLAPGVIVFPLLFLLNPGIRSLVWPADARAHASTGATTPVVMVVFDQLPLSSLVDPDGGIDRTLYPNFAALSDGSTWYRNATTVSDYTRWALPAIVTGRVPASANLPVAAHHPGSLFTLLGRSHAMHVYEPITSLCPQDVCGRDDEAIGDWMRDMAGTLGLAYLHAVLPASLEAGLPAVDQGWSEQRPDAPDDTIGERWFAEHREGRRREVLDFIAAIAPDEARPALHFMHVLLPHEPFIYFPGGQQFSIETSLPGLMGRETWRHDDWAVAQAYRRHLLQAGYVDKLLGALVARLKETGLYDRALVVVTSDHGASFRPGKTFRQLTPSTAMDILPVPLFIKAPGQTAGSTSDRNVESIDIVPTIASILGVVPTWPLDGSPVVDTAPARPRKRAFHDDASRATDYPASMVDELMNAARRRFMLFGSSETNPFHDPLDRPARGVIGLDVGTLPASDGWQGTFTLDVRGDFADVDPSAAFVPSYLAGTAVRADGERVVLAVAVNGRVVSTTQTYPFRQGGVTHAWSTVLPPDALRRGSNSVEIFVVEGGGLLRRVYRADEERLDLSTPAAVYAWRVTQTGFHDREWRAGVPFRWTRDVARVTVPLGARKPKGLAVDIMMSGRTRKPLRISANGCLLFEGVLPAGAWSRVFDLSACPDLGAQVAIELRTETTRSRNRADRRRLGVAVARIDLLDELPAR